MSETERRLDDIEKRLARLERAAEKPEVYYGGPMKHDMVFRAKPMEQWCPCGRDVCRAPDCPSHKPDSMGR